MSLGEIYYFNASKLGPANCEMGLAKIRYGDATASYTRIHRHFWVDSGLQGGKAYGKPGDYLVILNGVRRVVPADHFNISFVVLEEAP